MHVSPSQVALITLVTPVLALMVGMRVDGQEVGLLDWAGTSVTLAGLACYQWSGRPARAASATA